MNIQKYILCLFFSMGIGTLDAGIQGNRIIADEIIIVNDQKRPVNFQGKTYNQNDRITIQNKIGDEGQRLITIGNKTFTLKYPIYDSSKPVTDSTGHYSEPMSLKNILQSRSRQRRSTVLNLLPKIVENVRGEQVALLLRPVPGENKIEFDREKIVDAEGYWAHSANPAEDTYHGKYSFPKPNQEPWPTEDKFLAKLTQIEKSAGGARVKTTRYRGLAPSRLEPGVDLGSSEYVDTISGVTWTDAFGSYYVGKFHVKPSRQFYRFVMNFPLEEAGSWHEHEEL